jgi:Tol biopolymer transport system component
VSHLPLPARGLWFRAARCFRVTRNALSLALVGLALIPAQAAAESLIFESNDSLYVGGVDGSNPRLLHGPEFIYSEKWAWRNAQLSPDGTWFVATRECAQPFCSNYWNHTLVGRTDGSVFQQWAGIDEDRTEHPRWSPSGNRIVLAWRGVYSNTNGWDIGADNVTGVDARTGWLMSDGGSGGPDINLITWFGDQRRPEYSSDGGTLAFDSTTKPGGASYSDGEPRIYLTTAAGGSARELTAGTDPTFSRDGSKLAFQHAPRRGAPTQIYSVSAAGGKATRLTNNAYTDFAPQWSTNGARIYFSRQDASGCSLWSMNPDGSGQTKLINGGCNGSGRQPQTGAPDDVLLDRYSPILRYDEQEPYRADAADIITWPAEGLDPDRANSLERENGAILASANSQLGYPTLTLASLAPATSPTYPFGDAVLGEDRIDERNDTYQTDAATMHMDPNLSNKIYKRTVRDATGKLWLQYWFFYYYNEAFFGDHEADWEMIQLGIDYNGTPDVATYAQHAGGDQESCAWDRVQGAGGRPVVYVDKGSHASNFRGGTEYDNGEIITPRTERISETSHGWVTWVGRWGGSASEIRSPGRQGAKWDAPAQFNSDAQECSVSAPSSATAAGRRRGTTLRRSHLVAAPRVTARRAGGRALVRYRFRQLTGTARRRPAYIFLSVHSADRGELPRGKWFRVRARSGSHRIGLPFGPGPYRVLASAQSRRGATSDIVRVPLK